MSWSKQPGILYPAGSSLWPEIGGIYGGEDNESEVTHKNQKSGSDSQNQGSGLELIV